MTEECSYHIVWIINQFNTTTLYHLEKSALNNLVWKYAQVKLISSRF